MADLGLLAGLANGLREGLQSYRTERDYDLKKQQTAQELALKKRMADISGVEAYSKVLGTGGSDAANPMLSKLGLIDSSQPAPDPQPTDQSQSPVDQTSQASLPDGQGYLSAQGGFKPAANIPSEFDRGMIRFAAEKNAAEGDTGRHQEYDPKSRGFITSQVPLSPLAQTKLDKERAETKNAQLTPERETQHQYDSDKVTQDTRDAAFNFSKMVKSAQEKSPVADKGLVFNYIRIENPGAVAREGTLDDVREIPQLAARYSNMISMAENGTMTDAQRNEILRAGAAAYQGARESHVQVQQRYGALAKNRGVNPTFLNEPALASADQQAGSVINNVGPYKRQGAGAILQQLGLIGRKAGPTEAQAASGPKPGTIDGGYKYMGGDPADQKSWVKQ